MLPIASIDDWPNAFDQVVLAGYLAAIVLVVGGGYVMIYVDVRAHYRRFRRALVLMSNYTRTLPVWVRRESPPCLQAFGLESPFTRDELLEAYRERVKGCHPDLGGDRRQFLRLQQFFEQAMSLAEAD